MGFSVRSEPEVSAFTMQMIDALVAGNRQRVAAEPLKKSTAHPKLVFADPNSTPREAGGKRSEGEKISKKEKSSGGSKTLSKSLLNILNGSKHSLERLAFESDPQYQNTYASVYKSKLKLIPDTILKRIAIQDDLVAAIVNTRAAQIQTFGRPVPDRFSTGFKLDLDEEFMSGVSEEQRADYKKRAKRLEKLIMTCGETRGWSDRDKLTFPQFLGMTARNACIVGRLAVEVIYVEDEAGKRKAYSFRPIDAGTIYRAAPFKEAAQAVRDEALGLLESLKNETLQPERFRKDEYAWVQVMDGKPVQAFTEDECLVHNFFPVTDVELDGYPVTPIDTAIAAVTTHINITSHNRMYFQTGRAARGMLVFKSEDEVSDDDLTQIKHQFQASINNVSNSWRMPVFAIGANDEITWAPIDNGSRDMEFQYLSDSNARVIMSAFQISPEEMPGYQHLSRGTNSQALSESNNEYKLEASRDVGIRPFKAQFEDFMNQRILPLLDEELAKVCVLKFVGLDAETPEKESVRLGQDMPIHMTYDEVLRQVQKKPLGKAMGGDFPLNPQFRSQVLDPFYTVGEQLEFFAGKKDASKDPSLAFYRDPFWFQFQQLQMAAQQAQQQAANPQPPPGGGGGPPQGGGEQPPSDQGQAPPEQQPQGGDQGPDLTSGIEQAIGMLSKSESQLPPSRRRLLEQHRKLVDKATAHMEADLKELNEKLFGVASKFMPKA